VPLDLVRDVLDDQVVDRDGNKMGKVDGLVMEWQTGRQPRITHIAMGPDVWARRIGWRVVRRLATWLGRHGPRAPGEFRFPWSVVLDTRLDVRLDVQAKDTPAMAWERWLRRHVVKRIPGG